MEEVRGVLKPIYATAAIVSTGISDSVTQPVVIYYLHVTKTSSLPKSTACFCKLPLAKPLFTEASKERKEP